MSAAIHRIRLGPPWERTELPDGRLRYSRCFGKPTNLEPHERVVVAAPAEAEVEVNGARVEERDLTPLLLPRNTLQITLPAGTDLGEIALEIRHAV